VPSKLVLGRDADVVRETTDGLELDGRVRLRPGFVVEVLPRLGERALPCRVALVWTWRLRAVGSNGPIYRGICRWHRASGQELPGAARAASQTREKGETLPGITLDELRDA
jgi:hypothetical protein